MFSFSSSLSAEVSHVVSSCVPCEWLLKLFVHDRSATIRQSYRCAGPFIRNFCLNNLIPNWRWYQTRSFCQSIMGNSPNSIPHVQGKLPIFRIYQNNSELLTTTPDQLTSDFFDISNMGNKT